jgi:hypothetical protein
MGLVLDAWGRLISMKGGASAGPMAASASEKLTRLALGPDTWVFAIVIGAAVAGAVFWAPRNRRTLPVPAVWLAVAAAFGVVGIVTPLQVRSGLSARAPLAFLGAAGLLALWERGRTGRIAAIVLTVALFASSAAVVTGFFPRRLV